MYRMFFSNPPTSVLSPGSNHVCSLANPTSESAFLIIGTQWAANRSSEPLTKPTCIPRLFRVEAPKNVFHPALLNASPMSFTRSAQSSEPVIHHPNIICWGSLLSSDLNLSFCFTVKRRGCNCFSSSTRASFSDSAVRFASATRSFACAICNWNPSASCRAFSAASRAFAARSFSWLASRSVWAARSNALAARSPARLVFLWASANRVSSKVCMIPSALETKLSATNSPTTPTTISSHPTETSNLTHGGISVLACGCFRRLRIALTESCHISGNSNNSPNATTPVENSSQPKQLFLKDSKSDLTRSSRLGIVSSVANVGITIYPEDQRTDALLVLINFLAVRGIGFYLRSLLAPSGGYPDFRTKGSKRGPRPKQRPPKGYRASSDRFACSWGLCVMRHV